MRKKGESMKTFFKTIGGLIAVIILAAVVIAFIGWSRVPDMIATNLSKKMKVSVDIDDIHLGLGEIDVEKIRIGNPPKSVLAKAFSAESIAVKAPLTSYLKQDIVIDEIDISDIYLGLEFKSPSGTDGNWTTIMGNISSSQPAQPKEKSTRTVLIKQLVLTNISTELVYDTDPGKIRKLPKIDRIVLTNISSEGGFPIDQIASSVLGQMLKQVFIQENLKNMLEGVLQNAPDMIQNPAGAVENAIRGLFK